MILFVLLFNLRKNKIRSACIFSIERRDFVGRIGIVGEWPIERRVDRRLAASGEWSIDEDRRVATNVRGDAVRRSTEKNLRQENLVDKRHTDSVESR